MRHAAVIAVLALAALPSCRMAPIAPAQLGSITAGADVSADCWGRHRSHVPTVTSVEFLGGVTSPLSPPYFSIELGKSKGLGKDWTFALRVGSHWLLGPGLSKYFAWNTQYDRAMIVTYGLVPDCGYDIPTYGIGSMAGETKSSIQVGGFQLTPGWPYSISNNGTVLIFAASDMRSPWIPISENCNGWKSSTPLVPVQTFNFSIPQPFPSPDIAGAAPPAEDAVAVRRR